MGGQGLGLSRSHGGSYASTNEEAVTKIRSGLQRKAADGRRTAIHFFVNYLHAEDGHYCLVPKHEYYASQNTIRTSLKQQIELLCTKVGILSSSPRFTRSLGRIVTLQADRLSGLIHSRNFNSSVLVLASDVVDSTAARLSVGADVEFDVLEQDGNLKAVNVVVLQQEP